MLAHGELHVLSFASFESDVPCDFNHCELENSSRRSPLRTNAVAVFLSFFYVTPDTSLHIPSHHNLVIELPRLLVFSKTYPVATGLNAGLVGTANGAFLHGVKKTGCIIAGLYIGVGIGALVGTVGGCAGAL